MKKYIALLFVLGCAGRTFAAEELVLPNIEQEVPAVAAAREEAVDRPADVNNNGHPEIAVIHLGKKFFGGGGQGIIEEVIDPTKDNLDEEDLPQGRCAVGNDLARKIRGMWYAVADGAVKGYHEVVSRGKEIRAASAQYSRGIYDRAVESCDKIVSKGKGVQATSAQYSRRIYDGAVENYQVMVPKARQLGAACAPYKKEIAAGVAGTLLCPYFPIQSVLLGGVPTGLGMYYLNRLNQAKNQPPNNPNQPNNQPVPAGDQLVQPQNVQNPANPPQIVQPQANNQGAAPHQAVEAGGNNGAPGRQETLFHRIGKELFGGGGQGLKEEVIDPTKESIKRGFEDLKKDIHIHQIGKELFGGGGQGLKEEVIDPTKESIKRGFEHYGKKALWAVPAAIALWYGGSILKNQIEGYLNTPRLDIKVKRADDYRADGLARQMIFSGATSKKLKEVLEGARNAKIKKDYFKNILLYGPPGSGKRMFAEQLALYTNMDFYEVPWMALNKYKGAEAIDRFFKKDAIKSSHGAVIYIDNAQLLFSKASSTLASEMGTVVSSLIEHCQQPSTQYIVIFGIPEKPVLNAYNSSVIDQYQIIGITLPDYDERLKLLRLYRDQYFDKLSPEVNDVLSEEVLQSLARDLDRATAAELANFLKTVKNKSELPTAEGLRAIFEEELRNSKKLFEEFFVAE